MVRVKLRATFAVSLLFHPGPHDAQQHDRFARTDGSVAGVRWYWEVRSVNGRGLDVRVRLPPGHDQLEPKVREAAAKRFVRGSLTINLNAQRDAAAVEVRVNEAALAQVLRAVERGAALDRRAAAHR